VVLKKTFPRRMPMAAAWFAGDVDAAVGDVGAGAARVDVFADVLPHPQAHAIRSRGRK
jgi:hypothetical protein